MKPSDFMRITEPSIKVVINHEDFLNDILNYLRGKLQLKTIALQWNVTEYIINKFVNWYVLPNFYEINAKTEVQIRLSDDIDANYWKEKLPNYLYHIIKLRDKENNVFKRNKLNEEIDLINKTINTLNR